jgi:hypothetical protein
MVDTNTLIDTLSRSAPARRRPAPTWLRAAVWTLLALPSAELALFAFPRFATDWTRPGALWAMLSLVLAFAIGGYAIDTAFAISIPGRPFHAWKALIPMVAAWLALNIVSLFDNPVGHLGQGIYCYAFLMTAGAPMIALAILGLRRTRALHPGRSLAMAGLGAAFMSMALLSLCHPVGEHLIDFAMHLLAALTIVGLTVLLGRRAVAI